MKINRIELDKGDGLTIEVVTQDGVNRQTIFFDGKKITHTVVGPGGTSTIVQDPESIRIKCKKFVVDSETFEATGTSSAKLQAGGPGTSADLKLYPAFAHLSSATLAFIEGKGVITSGEKVVAIDAKKFYVTTVPVPDPRAAIAIKMITTGLSRAGDMVANMIGTLVGSVLSVMGV